MINEINFVSPIVNGKGRKKNLYLVLDCETCTLPFIGQMDLTSAQKQKLGIAKPLIYDLGWQIVDRTGHVYSRHSFLIQETFFVPQVFNTAYYSWKRPLYMERFQNGEIIVKTWAEATAIMVEDLRQATISTAYNAMFDYKKALPFTEKYMNALYSPYYQEWEERERKSCDRILAETKPETVGSDFDPDYFDFRGMGFPICDLWGLACKHLINIDKYKLLCLEEKMISASGLYFKTSAESTFRYLTKDVGFEEEHTALSDTIIETEILLKILKKVGLETGIEAFPFKELGEVTEFIMGGYKNKYRADKITPEMVDNAIEVIYENYCTRNPMTGYAATQEKMIVKLEQYKFDQFLTVLSPRYYVCKMSQLKKEIIRKKQYMSKLKKTGDSWKKCNQELSALEKQYKKLEKERDEVIQEFA